MSKEKLQWHPAFAAALRITLSEEMQYLELQEEYLLSKAPPKIDILVVKKLKEIAIRKKIGRIFRGHNIIEYKSPEDMTITFVSNCYPREMFRHLEKVRNITVERQSKGIYYLKGDAIPMQYLNLKELDADENYWLQALRTNLKAGEEIRTLVSNYEKNRHSKDYSAVMNLIARANWKQMEEEKRMCDALNELFAEELKEADAHGRLAGKQQGGIEMCKDLGLSYVETFSKIKEKYQLTEEQAKEIMDKNWK